MSDTATSGARLGIGRIIQLTFSALGRNAGPILLLSLAYSLISTGMPILIGRALASAEATMPSYLAWVPETFANLVPSAFLFGFTALVVVGDLSGRRPGPGAAAGGALRTLVPLAVVSVLAVVGIVLGMVLLIVPGVLLALRWWVAAAACAVEGTGVGGAFSRSAFLTKGHRGTLFGLLVLYCVAVAVLSGLAILAAGSYSSYAVRLVESNPLVLGVQVVVSAVNSALDATSSAVIYAELVRIKEGVLPGQVAAVFE